MSDLNQTLDRPYGQQTETRAAAARYLERSGNADLIDMLGLADKPAEPKAYVVIYGRSYCTTCHRRIPSGICLRTECQRQRRDDQPTGGAR